MPGCSLSKIRCALLLCLSCGWPAGVAAQNAATVENPQMDPEAMAQIYASMVNPGSAARMSDSDASCEQLYAESEYLEARASTLPKPVDPMEASARMQQELMDAQKKAMTGMRAKSMASSLLGMVPGVGGIAGSLASGAMGRSDGGMGAMNDATQKMMKEMMDNNQAMMATAQLQMRKGHVTELFLSRDCKVSALDRTAVASARNTLQRSGGEQASSAPASPDAQDQSAGARETNGAAQ